MNLIVGLARLLFGLYFFLYALIHVLLWATPFTANFGIFMNTSKCQLTASQPRCVCCGLDFESLIPICLVCHSQSTGRSHFAA